MSTDRIVEADLLVKGNAVVPGGVVYNAAIAIADGRIVQITDDHTAIKAKRTIDASGSYLLPGAIDAHVHCFSSLDEGFTHASRSAAAGGVTTFIEMPYDATGIICTRELLEEKAERLERESVVDIALLATIKPGAPLEETARLAAAGACGFKVSMFNTDSFRFPRIDDGELLAAFAAIAETGCPVGVHAENDDIVRRYISRYEDQGDSDPRAHAYSRPKVAESVASLTAMELAYTTGVKLHIYHATFKRIFDFVSHYRSQGARITAETCTHYLVFDEEDMREHGAKLKINPPLRSRDDVQSLWQLIASGQVDMVTSDHAPWTMERKADAHIFRNSSGAPGVEALLPIMYSEGVAKGRITIEQLARVLSERPAEVFGLDYCKGSLAEGKDADIVILDPSIAYELNEREHHSSAGWSPYHGRPLQGRVTMTIVRGEPVYDGGAVIDELGFGRFVPAKHKAEAEIGREPVSKSGREYEQEPASESWRESEQEPASGTGRESGLGSASDIMCQSETVSITSSDKEGFQ